MLLTSLHVWLTFGTDRVANYSAECILSTWKIVIPSKVIHLQRGREIWLTDLLNTSLPVGLPRT